MYVERASFKAAKIVYYNGRKANFVIIKKPLRNSGFFYDKNGT